MPDEWNAPPAIQLYVRDWLMSTRTLPPEARGIYLDLLCLAWDQDGLPGDPIEVLPHLAITPARFKRIWPLIQSKWQENGDGRLRNPRQEKQRAEVVALRKKRAKAGRKGGQANAKQTPSK